MATVHRRTMLHNPHKRHRKVRKNWTPAQIAAGFGGKRRQAAAKGSRKRRRNASHAVKHHRPRSRPRAAPPRRRRKRSNPGEIISVALGALGNPHKKRRTTVARSKKRKTSHRRRARSNYTHRSRRSNPVARRHSRRRTTRTNRRRRSNPAISAGGVGSYVTFSLWAIAGMLGSRAIPEALLGASNTGLIGYGANAAVAVLGGPLLGKVMKNRRAGVAFTVGGILSMVARALQEYTPFGAQIKQAFALQGVGDYGMAGLGEYLTNNQFAQPLQMQNTDWPSQVPASTFVRSALPPPQVQMRGLGLAQDKIYSGSSIWN